MTFVGYIETETDRAFFFQDHYWSAPDWLPKSQLTVFRGHDTHEVRLLASAWICEQKKIKEFENRCNDAT